MVGMCYASNGSRTEKGVSEVSPAVALCVASLRRITSHPLRSPTVRPSGRTTGVSMDRAEVRELHFITPIENLASILKRGILSHNRAERIRHSSVASEDVQRWRRRKRLPGGLPLHDYANLYFHARNAMMSYLLYGPGQHHQDLVVLRVFPEVLDLPNTVVTDGNSAAPATRFYPSPEGLRQLDAKLIFARSWTDEKGWAIPEAKRARMAEVLVPNLVPSRYIRGCYVDTSRKRSECSEYEALRSVVLSKEVYFK
jgi:ssDNA thymidine ADP-ribosyltransferase, DarT